MLEVYALLLICTILAYMVRNATYSVDQDGVIENRCYPNGKVFLFILLSYFVLFAGLRTRMNDTALYISNFTRRVPGIIEGIRQVDWSIGANPIFEIYQIILKTFVSSNGQMYIFTTALIVEVLMIRFLHRYSVDFGFSVYIFIAFTVFAFTMAAMKQTLATAIGLWAIPAFLKNKKLKAAIILLIGILVHPYVFMYIATVFLAYRGTWNKRIYIILFFTVLVGAFYGSFISGMVSAAEMIGDEYDITWFAQGTGVGIMRIISYMIAPVLAFLSKQELRNNSDPMQDLCVNFSIVAMCLSIISGFGGAMLFGRLPNYFDVFICISIPYILNNGSDILKNKIVKAAIVVAFLVFYYTYYKKYFDGWGISMFGSVYNRISLFELIKNW